MLTKDASTTDNRDDDDDVGTYELNQERKKREEKRGKSFLPDNLIFSAQLFFLLLAK